MTVIIAEAGSGPAPQWDFPAWCDAAQQAGATAIKMQCFHFDHFPEEEHESKLPLEFPRHRMAEFVSHAHSRRLQAGVSVFDEDAVHLAARHCDFIKLASREQFNTQLEVSAFYTHKPVYRSVHTLEPVLLSMRQVTLFTVPQYPAPLVLSCLRALQAARHYRRERARWGWSSHTTGTLDVLLACRLGAIVIEKHLDLDGRGLEAGHSLTPDKFAAMVSAIRKLERK